jgi:hypothetical protein
MHNTDLGLHYLRMKTVPLSRSLILKKKITLLCKVLDCNEKALDTYLLHAYSTCM